MEQVVHKFRTSIGGFNRRDVLSYIEGMDANFRRQTGQLTAELEKTRGERDELETTLLGLRDENGSVAAEEAKVRASLEESTRTLARVRGELSQAESKLAVARSELARLQGQVEQLEPMAKSYEELKDRVATVELDAHKKAQATVDEAQAEAAQLRDGARQWLCGILGQYEQLRQAVDGLEKHLNTVSRLADELREGDEAAARLREWGGVQ